MEQAHGAHPPACIHEHPLQVLVWQDVAWVLLSQLHNDLGESQLMVQPCSTQGHFKSLAQKNLSQPPPCIPCTATGSQHFSWRGLPREDISSRKPSAPVDPAPMPPWMVMEDKQHRELQSDSPSQVLGDMGDPSKVTVPLSR